MVGPTRLRKASSKHHSLINRTPRRTHPTATPGTPPSAAAGAPTPAAALVPHPPAHHRHPQRPPQCHTLSLCVWSRRPPCTSRPSLWPRCSARGFFRDGRWCYLAQGLWWRVLPSLAGSLRARGARGLATAPPPPLLRGGRGGLRVALSPRACPPPPGEAPVCRRCGACGVRWRDYCVSAGGRQSRPASERPLARHVPMPERMHHSRRA